MHFPLPAKVRSVDVRVIDPDTNQTRSGRRCENTVNQLLANCSREKQTFVPLKWIPKEDFFDRGFAITASKSPVADV